VHDDHSDYPGAPPGWYADPAGGPGQRWWDGYAWNEAVVFPVQPPQPPGAARPGDAPVLTSGVPALVIREVGLSPMARLALAVPGVYYLVWLMFLRVYATQLRSIGHQFHLVMQAAQNNQTAPTVTIPTFTGAISTLENVVSLVALAAVVVCCVWQYRAASAARALGLPARHTPGWGVAFWFIPIVNLWMPYQALRDCLDGNDPNRGVILRYWLFLLGAELGFSVGFVVSWASTPATLVISLPAALCCLGVLANAPRVVTSIANAHRAISSGSGDPTPVTR